MASASLDDIDLVALRGTTLVRVQVKSTAARSPIGYRFSLKIGRGKRISRDSVDIIACAMLDLRKVYFMTSSRLPLTYVVKDEKLMVENVEAVSWHAALRECGMLKDEETS